MSPGGSGIALKRETEAAVPSSVALGAIAVTDPPVTTPGAAAEAQ